MSCMQITACVPLVNVKDITSSRCSSSSQLGALPNYSIRLSRTSLRLASVASRYQRCTPVCLFGGKGKPQNDNEASPWKSLENAMGGLKKEKSVQDILREQMLKQEFDDSGGGIGTPPSGGGGGGGDGSGESKDEGEGILEEFLQTFLATVGFILLYLFIIDGEDLYKLSRDYIKYFFTKKKSVRVTRSMEKWQHFYDEFLTRKKVRSGVSLEEVILSTPTWWHDPSNVKRRRRRNRRRLASVY